MRYYPHHIGDFNSGTRHLTRLERSIYRDLIELYYDTESPLINNLKKLSRKIMARTDEEIEALENILEEYFKLNESEEYFHHSKCDKVLEKYFAECSKLDEKRESDRLRKAASREKRAKLFSDAKALGISTTIDMTNIQIQGMIRDVTSDKSKVTKEESRIPEAVTDTVTINKNQEPRTKNQEPITNNQKPIKSNPFKYDLSSWPNLPDLDLYNDWLKAKRKSGGTVSQRAINTIGKNLTNLKALGYSVNFCLEKAESSGWKGIEIHYLQSFSPDLSIQQKSFAGIESVERFVSESASNDQNTTIEGDFNHV
jgi:uncharacterized protein YdaU (DUF1376 family)